MYKKILSICITLLLLLTSAISAVSALDEQQTSETTSPVVQSSSPEGPTADAGGPYYATVGIPIQFDGTSSYHNNGTIVSYEWFCGDGEVETGSTPTHTYLSSGTYDLILSVKDTNDECGTDTTEVIVSEDSPPEAFFDSPKQGSFYYRNMELFSSNKTTLVIGPCDITVGATDDVQVQRVEIYIDGVRKHIDFEEPYTYTWRIGSLRHNIKAIIYDSSGHETIIEQTVFKWRLHPLLLLKTLASLRQQPNNDLFNWGSKQDSNVIGLLTVLQFLLQLNQQDDNVLSTLLKEILSKDQNNLNLYDFLNNHPIIKNRLKNKYPFVYRLVMLSNGEFSSGEDKSFFDQKLPLIKTIATLGILKTVYNKTRTILQPEPTGLESLYQWMRNHPYLLLTSALLFIAILTRATSDFTDSENDNFDEPSENRIPHANAGGPYEQEQGKIIVFSAADSYDEDGTIVSFIWDFGDGTTGNGETIEHLYESTGTYLVTLTVVDEDGAQSNDTITVRITDQTSTPISETESADASFWIISGGLSAMMLIGLAGIKFRRRFFE